MRKVIIFLIIFSAVLVIGCAQEEEPQEEITRPVKVTELEKEARAVELDYIGTVESNEQKKYSFEVGGKIADIYVEEGDYIQARQSLASLDTEKINYRVSEAEINVDKTQKYYEEALENYEKMQQLYENGAVSEEELDEARIQMEKMEQNYEQAKVAQDMASRNLSDAEIKADMNGYVVNVLFEEGEIVGGGTPVVAARGPRQVIKTGLSQQDAKRVDNGARALVTIDGLQAEGTVTSIKQVPDGQSRTYETEIELTESLPQDQFYLGQTAEVSISIGEEEGIWIPIDSIMNDGMDYVYLVQEKRAVRKNISLEKARGNKVMVTGLSEGDRLVTEGLKDLLDGSRVSVEN